MSLAHNDVSPRPEIWRRLPGDDWAAFDALPASIRRRLAEHAYDAWAVNALALWRSFRRSLGPLRAERRLMRWIEECEREERSAFAARQGAPLPHEAAGATVMRWASRPASARAGAAAGPSPAR
ncbi:DUF6525 family protein [Sabulicella glaciei]|uniref:DUF6525 family protein n=1 Tax=Sabulicella glaciei TaxID=2984948 RepID=A0ABT3NXX5_9PROT|nr:DUF6525 family protein [Roseococcus sp. MDT2-1-1]MCW8087017.1 DUF6525 family protein [Roseococcus sp. MDT2-1-1]